MTKPQFRYPRILLTVWLLWCLLPIAVPADTETNDPLPSWNTGVTKDAIVAFVARVTSPGSKDFVPVEQRIAVFDHDGTLWSEQPAYVQMTFAIDRVRAMAPHFPNWKTKQPFKAAIEGDFQTLAKSGTAGLMQLIMATHAGMTTDQFDQIVRDWLSGARHPRFHRRYTELVYQPMLELLGYLRANGFKTWIVSGGGADFIRVWAEGVYGIPPEQVVGSTLKTKFEIAGNQAVLVRLPEIDFIDNLAGKPVAIHKFIGRRPIIAIGNSDGDKQMLQWTAAGGGPSFVALIHHTDASREWAYDRKSQVGRLDDALKEARTRHWLVVDMRQDWKRIFPFER